jgi:hypothetical protein
MKTGYRNINRDFSRIFYRKESRELFGRDYINFVLLVMILVLTFLAVGFSNGSLEYLKRKMDDPFIKWVDIVIPFNSARSVPELIEMINNDSLKQAYHYGDCDGYNQLTAYFYMYSTESERQFTGRTIRHDDPILKSILSANNLIEGRVWKDELDIGLIVTRQLMETLGYNRNSPPFILMSYPILGGKYAKVPLPVAAIVKDLPGNNLFAFTPYFFNKRTSMYYPFDITASTYQLNELIYFFEGDRKHAEKSASALIEIMRTDSLSRFLSDTLILENNSTYKKGHDLILYFKDELSDDKLVSDFDLRLQKDEEFIQSGGCRIYNFDLSGFEKNLVDFDFLSVNFTSLDRIREFSSLLSDLGKLKIDMSQIESKENYNFVSKLTVFISGFLVIFSILSVILFLLNVLKAHITKIKPNLGTFKAFGLDNNIIVRIYSLLTVRFLLLGIIFAFTIAAIIGQTGLFRFLFMISGTVTDENVIYFNLLADIKTYIALLIILGTNLVILPLNISRMLNKTPGDLIYRRS